MKMIVIMADLIATSEHNRWAVGSEIESLLFVSEDTYDKAEDAANTNVRDIGWEISSIKKLARISAEQVNKMDELIKQAFENAVLYGFGVVTYSEENRIEKNT